MLNTFKQHWPEYLMEAIGLGIFMISACFFTMLLEHPASPVQQSIAEPIVRHSLIGLAMALTLISIIYSPIGQKSGAHMNPALTWTYYRLGKIEPWDAGFYTIAQFIGGVTGVLLMKALVHHLVSHPSVNYAVTVPGMKGHVVAFVAEVAISFLLMLTVLFVSNTRKIARYTPLFAGALVATYITLEAPLSGMSMNPARTVGSAFSADVWTGIWLYFVAPPVGMLLAGETYVRIKGIGQVFCAKLNHFNKQRCIFRCNFEELLRQPQNSHQKHLTEETTMLKKLSSMVLLIGIFSLTAVADHVKSASDKAITFKVRIENVSTADILKSAGGQTAPAGLSPGVFVLYNGKDNPMFVPGHKDHGVGLEMQAEDGNPTKLAEAMAKDGHVIEAQVFNIPVGAKDPGPVGPGSAYEFSFSASPKTKLAYTQMFGQSNDLFYAVGKDGIDLFDKNGNPIMGDITDQIQLWDAGTEVNQEPGFGADQAPRQAAPNTGESESTAIASPKDGFTYPPTNKVIMVTITHQ